LFFCISSLDVLKTLPGAGLLQTRKKEVLRFIQHARAQIKSQALGAIFLNKPWAAMASVVALA
jgi:hypothetical protein